ncbi:MAG: hypothetical protein G01um101420_141 [Parcubacteria group bacterium Gr01-1014_20]|nr:MAG: hypothetical protein G01um101420_141 [Parcubacteria group bacterium Gr01-1014_20]
MGTMSFGKLATLIGGVAVLGIIAASLGGVFNNQFADGGVDVRNTACEDLASARIAIGNELEERKLAAQEALDAERETISDAYWDKNRALEAEHHACISRALTADPCKKPFEEVGRLYEEIMADFDAGKGFNEAKFNEREAAKKRYNDCVEDTHKPDFYKEKETVCDATLAAGREANQVDRQAKEAAAKTRYDEAVLKAQSAHQEKSAILDAIEKKCKEPGGTSNVNVGAINTGGTGTPIQPNSLACTGVFSGNNPDLQRQITDLENQLQKAKAAGLREGLSGIDHIQGALDDLRQELKDSERTCKVDADCGNPEPVCCSGKQVGRAYCDAGVCASEKKDCVDPEICAGKPAACVAPDTGVQQQDGVYISRTIPEAGSCSQNLQVLNLKQATSDSARYAIVGNIPNWLHIDKPGGSLPAKVNVTYSCNTVQGFGPGTYTVNGSITVKNAANELVNTIPFNVSITVTAAEGLIEVIEYKGKYLPVGQLIIEDEVGCGAEHWHAAQGVVTATDGTKVSDPGPQCGYGKVKDKPVKKVPAPNINAPAGNVEVRGLEFLKNQ